MIVWYVLLGAILISGTLIALVFLLPKWVAGQFEHGSECSCNGCSVRRMQKWERLNDQRGQQKGVTPLRLGEAEMVSTNELNTNDIVTSADSGMGQQRYTVRELVIRDYGWVVILENRKTGALAWIRITNARLDVPLWRRYRQPHRRGHVTGL